jgi:hypothetical protein
MKVKYPITEGWMTTTLQLPEKGHQMDRNEVILAVMNGKPQDFELAEYRNMATVVRLIYRRKKKVVIRPRPTTTNIK